MRHRNSKFVLTTWHRPTLSNMQSHPNGTYQQLLITLEKSQRSPVSTCSLQHPKLYTCVQLLMLTAMKRYANSLVRLNSWLRITWEEYETGNWNRPCQYVFVYLGQYWPLERFRIATYSFWQMLPPQYAHGSWSRTITHSLDKVRALLCFQTRRRYCG